MKNYKKDYERMDLTIPAHIMSHTKINGVQKMMMALWFKTTNNGQKPTQFLSRITAGICNTHEKDILYNADQLHQKGLIELYMIGPESWVKYTYKAEKVEIGEGGLF